MEWLIALAVGALMGGGVYLSLRSRSLDVVLGLTLISYAVNLCILAAGRLRHDQPPVLRDGLPTTLGHYADPLPQALVLTAIVISFAMTALLAALAVRAARGGSDHVDSDPESSS